MIPALLGALVLLPVTNACEVDDCCPVSETFTCTDFQSGGARSLNGGTCPAPLTDNIAKMVGKKTDAKGCSYWEPDPAGGRTCGVAAPRDGGGEAGDSSTTDGQTSDAAASDAAADEASDAP